MMEIENNFINGEALEVLKTLPDNSIDCIVTSPPYWNLRDYGIGQQLGLENDFREYINRLSDIFDEAYRVLKEDGTCWVNIGDSYANSSVSGHCVNGEKTQVKCKSLLQIPLLKLL